MRNYTIIFLLIAAVAVSGCVQGKQVKTDDNNGLVINSFTAEPKTAFPTDSVSFFLDAENVGSFTSECARAQLFNVDSWRLTDGRKVSDELEGVPFRGVQVSPGGISINIVFGRPVSVSVNIPFGDADPIKQQFKDVLCGFNSLGSFSDQLVKTDIDILPPDVDRNRAGKIFATSWTLFPPVLPEGVSTTFNPKARVYYLYQSNAIAKIPVLSINEFRRRQNTGQDTTLVADISNQHSPVKIALTRGGDRPIVVDTNPKLLQNFNTQKERSTFVFEMQNVGNGFVTPAEFIDGKQGGFIFGKIILDGTGVEFSDCLGVTEDQHTKEVIVSGDNALLLKMRSDKKVPFACTIAVDRNVWQTLPQGEVTLRFQMFYVYNVDAEAPVKVVGVESGQTVEEVETGPPG
ncbi:MAG: hypothetical protein HYW26_02855 [Candidatus Aenigmarchaeota archaeon]|nr:hypothetical protein [Candidatus Aenigmarchaeota archaeon]